MSFAITSSFGIASGIPCTTHALWPSYMIQGFHLFKGSRDGPPWRCLSPRNQVLTRPSPQCLPCVDETVGVPRRRRSISRTNSVVTSVLETMCCYKRPMRSGLVLSTLSKCSQGGASLDIMRGNSAASISVGNSYLESNCRKLSKKNARVA